MSRVSFFLPLSLFALIVGFAYFGFSLGDRHELPSALIGKAFPEFEAQRLLVDAESFSNEDFAGRPALVNVWATWCPTCLSEHEQLMQIAAQTDILLVGVNYKDDVNKARRWLAEYGNPYDAVVVDMNGDLGVQLGVYGAPETFLLNARGEIVFKRVGDVNPRVWRDELRPRLVQMGAVVESFEVGEVSSQQPLPLQPLPLQTLP